MNNTPIYVIMVFSKCEKDDRGFLDMGATRIVGFRHELENAIKSVKNNVCDIWEHCYTYAVVEKVEPTIYPSASERWFFKYNVANGEYEAIDEPMCFANACALTMG